MSPSWLSDVVAADATTVLYASIKCKFRQPLGLVFAFGRIRCIHHPLQDDVVPRSKIDSHHQISVPLAKETIL
jgi:hypothetical protein